TVTRASSLNRSARNRSALSSGRSVVPRSTGYAGSGQAHLSTDGPSTRVVPVKRTADLRHASPKHLIAPSSPVGTVVQCMG
ncbi:MAG: hypothetical protein E5V19_08425, partial [Mesorhizobium sp.]